MDSSLAPPVAPSSELLSASAVVALLKEFGFRVPGAFELEDGHFFITANYDHARRQDKNQSVFGAYYNYDKTQWPVATLKLTAGCRHFHLETGKMVLRSLADVRFLLEAWLPFTEARLAVANLVPSATAPATNSFATAPEGPDHTSLGSPSDPAAPSAPAAAGAPAKEW